VWRGTWNGEWAESEGALAVSLWTEIKSVLLFGCSFLFLNLFKKKKRRRRESSPQREANEILDLLVVLSIYKFSIFFTYWCILEGM
jgi:hypothetical protein